MKDQRVIRLDWALKSMLRDKANFDVLEGFLAALLKEDIQVLSLLESESNAEEEQQKFNRVDLLVEDTNQRQFIIEIQNEQEADYIERLLFGTSKVIAENLQLGHPYREIKKVISISILYFNLGIGDDYVYYGNTEFKGIHTGTSLKLQERVHRIEEQKKGIRLQEKQNIFPEYYLIRVENFPDLIAEDLDEWIFMLKNEEVKEEFKSKNIQVAAEKLNVLKMTAEEKKKYEQYLMNLASERDIILTAKEEGREEGREEGHKEGWRGGEKSAQLKIAKSLQKKGVPLNVILESTGLTKEDVDF